MPESFSLMIQSNNSLNRISNGSTTSNYSYFVAWDSIIPEKYKQSNFNLSFTFFTSPSTTVQDITQLHINLAAKPYIFNQMNSSSYYLGCVMPYAYTSTLYYMKSAECDNVSIQVVLPLAVGI